MWKKHYFSIVIATELVILAAFVWFLIYLFPTLDPKGYLFYGSALYVPYLQEEIASTPVIVVRWLFFLLTAGMLLPMMVTILAEIVRWRINRSKLPDDRLLNIPDNNPDEKQIDRFDFHLKTQHFLIIIGVTLAGILGLAQAFPDLAVFRWFVQDALGGLAAKRQFHHYFAYIIDLSILYYIGYLIYKFFIKKEKLNAMVITFQDLKDFINRYLYTFGFKKDGPEYGRYTFGQKFDFYIIIISVPTLTLSGLAMHYTSVSAPILTPMGIALAAVVHRSVAIFLAWFIISVHFYYAHLLPFVFPMNTVFLTGKMSYSRYKALYSLDRELLG
ncbi:cytochrome b/b6 domain-containing protein [Chloroflexota bacterium]